MASPPPIYLDNAATTRTLPAVIEAMARVQRDHFGNPSSDHGFADGPRKALTDAREFLRGTVGAAQLVLTSGGTEADLLGITGAVQNRSPGRVLIGAADHPAVSAQAAMLAKSQHRVTAVPVDAGGTMEPEALFDLLGKDVRGVAILHGHNELGGMARLEELVSTVRHVQPDAHVHVDLVQTYGKVAFDLDDAGVDSVAVSAHKFHGPRGVGFLALGAKARVTPVILGGGQEHGLRGGTENVAGAVGMATAAEHCLSHTARSSAHMEQLCALLLDRIARTLPAVERLGTAERRLPHVLSLRLPGVIGASLQQRADASGLAFSTGSACHDSHARNNPVLAAAGLSKRAGREVVRLSVAFDTDEAQIERAAEIICTEIENLTGTSGRLSKL